MLTEPMGKILTVGMGKVLDIYTDHDVSVELVKAGLAWHYKQYSKDPVLAKAEVEARRARMGLWAKPVAVPPWEWRMSHGEEI